MGKTKTPISLEDRVVRSACYRRGWNAETEISGKTLRLYFALREDVGLFHFLGNRAGKCAAKRVLAKMFGVDRFHLDRRRLNPLRHLRTDLVQTWSGTGFSRKTLEEELGRKRITRMALPYAQKQATPK